MATSGEQLYQKIDTFVFFDLETTNLIRGNQMPRIIELAMVAAPRDSIKADKRNKLALPRILHKLCIPICPNKVISTEASYMTNLWNDTLENINPFDEKTYSMIMQFLECLPGLVCFVAHNGNRFDYPVFLSEIDRIQKSIPDKILCVDTLAAFEEFFNDKQSVTVSPPIQNIPMGRDEVDEEELSALERSKSKTLIEDDNWNDALYSVLDEFEKVTPNSRKSISPSECGKDVLDSISNKPQKTVCDYAAPNVQLSPRSVQALNEKTPESQILRKHAEQKSSSSHSTLSGVRRQLNFANSKPKNLKLCTVYAHIMGCEPDEQHCAEADCISMLRCVCHMGPPFVEWADSNAVSLNLFKRKVTTLKK